MNILTRDQILKADDLKSEVVEVPEWGGAVCVRALNGSERDKFESSIVDMKTKGQNVNLANIRAKLASLSICDEKGKRLFTESDVSSLGQKSASALQRVFVVAQRLSGITEEEVNTLAEDIEKDPFGGSPSD